MNKRQQKFIAAIAAEGIGNCIVAHCARLQAAKQNPGTARGKFRDVQEQYESLAREAADALISINSNSKDN
jgi:hypothetical protein